MKHIHEGEEPQTWRQVNERLKLIQESIGQVGKDVSELSASGPGLTEPANIATSEQSQAWSQLNQQIRLIEKSLGQIGGIVSKLSVSKPTVKGPEELAAADQVRDSAQKCREALNGIVMDATKYIVNDQLSVIAEPRSDERDNEEKKRLSKHVNETLRQQGAVIAHPETREPCLLLAVGSPDGYGRYVLANRETKQRSHTSRALADMLPFTPMPDVPRRESFLERRNAEQPPHPQSWAKRHSARGQHDEPGNSP